MREVVRLANDTPFGLSGSGWTRDLGRAIRVSGRTGMAAGDRLPGLVGPEYDSVDVSPEAPAGLAVLARSPVVARTGQESGGLAIPGAPSQTATFYQAPSGASVFSAGTIQWSWGLDGWSSRAAGLGRTRRSTGTPVDPRAGVITSNLLSRLGWRAEA